MIKITNGTSTCNILRPSDDRVWKQIQDFQNSLGYVYEYSIEDYFCCCET